MKKKYTVIIMFIIVLILIIFISKNMFKKSKFGNNMDSQEIVDQILNINSYIAEIEVQVNSNKNQNKYKIKQEYNTENGCMQEVIEPLNIAGVKITNKDNILTIENSELSLKNIYENYEELENNNLDLHVFLKEFKDDENSNFEEKDEEIVMHCRTKNLYIKKDNLKPEKLIIKGNNQNQEIIIKYINIELN